jgi:hypothetical protein
MYSYIHNENPEGSHFFIQSKKEHKFLFSINHSFEEYEDEYLEEKVKTTYLQNFVVTPKPTFCASCELFETVGQIIFNHINSDNIVVKIELENQKARKDIIDRFFKDKPENVIGLTHVVDGNKVYYFFNKTLVASDKLIASLISEFGGNDNTNKSE